MRVAALADVHGNAVALEAVLAELVREQPDLIVSCGDLTWGPLPLETVALLEPWRERLRCVRGNSERELVERKLIDSELAVWEHEQHDHAELAEYLARTQASVRVEVDGLGTTLFCHGSPRSDEECVTVETPAARVAEFTAGVGAAVVVTAHTHMQYDRRVGETRLLNPGSVGLPYEPEPGHAYWALLGPDVELRRTAYDLDAAIERLRAEGMPAFERIEELMRTPPPRAEVIEHAERVVFAG
ncbi:MAG TPA: metallophosphoesterase family protein [Gaiellaceae bacterium]|nr:metallophosphoesterase family protein [Gaiellaceae bacterium]